MQTGPFLNGNNHTYLKGQMMSDVSLPAVMENTLPVIDQLTNALGVPRDIIASGAEIQTVIHINRLE